VKTALLEWLSMDAETKVTPREQSRLAVRRLTKALAGLALAATAAFAAAAGFRTVHHPGAAEQPASAVVENDGWDDDGWDDGGGFGLTPSQGVWSTSRPPSATSGGS
jgi:hypothetical protein